MLIKHWLPFSFLVVFTSLIPINQASAHCDTLDGPVVMAAKVALKNGDVTPVLKWVSTDDEDIIKAAFDKTVTVRSQSKEAMELADMYFFETLVRIHRASEGAPYLGLQPANSTSPIIQLTDKAIESGAVDELKNALLQKLSRKLVTDFEATKNASKNADNSVQAGRHFVKQYVEFTHFVEAVHELLDNTSSESIHADHTNH